MLTYDLVRQSVTVLGQELTDLPAVPTSVSLVQERLNAELVTLHLLYFVRELLHETRVWQLVPFRYLTQAFDVRLGRRGRPDRSGVYV